MDVPNEDDWRSEPGGIDTPHAYDHFHGKTLEDATKLFAENVLYYQEDVIFMPSRVFGYYLRAYMTYLMSDAAKGDSDVANCFVGLIAHKANCEPDDLRPAWTAIEQVLRKIALEQEFYDAEWIYYGSFRTAINKIVNRGFKVSFDTASSEVPPPDITISRMAGTNRILPIEVAIPILATGIKSVSAIDLRGHRQSFGSTNARRGWQASAIWLRPSMDSI